MSSLQMVVSAAGLIGIGWIFWLTLIDGRRRQTPVMLLVVGAVDALCGLSNFLLGSAHFFAVLGRGLRGKGLHAAQAFIYDFRFYSLAMLVLLLIVPGVLCLRSARGLTRGEAIAWKNAFWASV